MRVASASTIISYPCHPFAALTFLNIGNISFLTEVKSDIYLFNFQIYFW